MRKPKVFCVGELASRARTILTSVSMLLARSSVEGCSRALDNVFCERLWRSVQYENIYLNQYVTVRQLQAGLSAYFDFYNMRDHIKVSTIAHRQKSTSCSDQGRPHPSGCTLFLPFHGPVIGTHYSRVFLILQPRFRWTEEKEKNLASRWHKLRLFVQFSAFFIAG